MTKEELTTLQRLPLEIKIRKTEQRIMEWYEHWQGDVYLSFSGGKDSTVLLDIARKIYPKMEAVFADTGLEYPEIREFVRGYDNVTWVKPEMTFKQVLDQYGYPVIGKEVSCAVHYAKRGSRWAINKMEGRHTNGSTHEYNKRNTKYKYLMNAPFEISDHCCAVMKKKPFKRYEKETQNKPIVGTMACESFLRQTHYLENGCNAFESTRKISTPIGFWTEQDILKYLLSKHIPIAKVYGQIVLNGKIYLTTGLNRTGCMFCMYGVHHEKEPNRFQMMAGTHPKQYDYCINKLGLGEVLDYIDVPYRPDERKVKIGDTTCRQMCLH